MRNESLCFSTTRKNHQYVYTFDECPVAHFPCRPTSQKRCGEKSIKEKKRIVGKQEEGIIRVRYTCVYYLTEDTHTRNKRLQQNAACQTDVRILFLLLSIRARRGVFQQIDIVMQRRGESKSTTNERESVESHLQRYSATAFTCFVYVDGSTYIERVAIFFSLHHAQKKNLKKDVTLEGEYQWL